MAPQRRLTRQHTSPWPAGASLLVDGNNLLVRSVFAVRNSLAMLTSDGVLTGPLVVFVNQLARAVREVRPDRVLVCWDYGGSVFREAVASDYKANREATPANDGEVYGTRVLAEEFLYLSRLAQVGQPGVEADDLLAAAWRVNSGPFVILSGDKDFRQLLGDDTVIMVPGRDDPYTAKELLEDVGCEPEQVPLVMALAGDHVDNVAGVPRFGYKTAVKALAAADWSLPTVMENPKVSPHRDRVVSNLLMVDLRHNLVGAVETTLVPFRPTAVGDPTWDDFVDFAGRYELNSILSRAQAGTLWS